MSCLDECTILKVSRSLDTIWSDALCLYCTDKPLIHTPCTSEALLVSRDLYTDRWPDLYSFIVYVYVDLRWINVMQTTETTLEDNRAYTCYMVIQKTIALAIKVFNFINIDLLLSKFFHSTLSRQGAASILWTLRMPLTRMSTQPPTSSTHVKLLVKCDTRWLSNCLLRHTA